ncbi:hypothetical protein [Flagellimonas aequoris]|uniref:Transposase InsH N-terminal domain-containing protein n=1 Tax=Flagellimonas aequoris TaxID=2306997 RepID=A0ABY3KRX6_9FLAO|nr:hypothetical protein [Allomuricauda aequoris]TXK01046.1 hypothetical protein FQ019_13200 [Allomuricauda aequoris]
MMYKYSSNSEGIQTDFDATFLCKPFLGLCLGKAANPSVRPSNFKGSLIKEALVVFRGIEKQGRAQGLPIRTPSPAVA